MTHPAHHTPEPALPRLYTVQEVAAHLRCCPKTAVKRFEREKGTIILYDKKPGKQRYRIMLIPGPVLERVKARWEVR